MILYKGNNSIVFYLMGSALLTITAIFFLNEMKPTCCHCNFLNVINSKHNNLQFIERFTSSFSFLILKLKHITKSCNRGLGENRLIPVFF